MILSLYIFYLHRDKEYGLPVQAYFSTRVNKEEAFHLNAMKACAAGSIAALFLNLGTRGR
jgi:hypothetical protein